MGKVIYAMNVSLDGFVETPDHDLSWGTIDEEIHTWWNEQTRKADAALYGRRIWEVMSAHWPQGETDPNATDAMREFARIWNRQPKVVFSSSLTSIEHDARLVKGDVGEILAELRREFDGDLDVSGPNLAGQFIERGLVDEFRLVVHPVVIGGGTPFFPRGGRPLKLELIEQRRFASGPVYLAYRRAG
ncbi:MAG TPA: dihydrofolate reductase family protein [Candidatus Limnocylindria bacterium]|nr:dihydrofolate reductase family protein [Candidatus Limnocylindria bacterium]